MSHSHNVVCWHAGQRPWGQDWYGVGGWAVRPSGTWQSKKSNCPQPACLEKASIKQVCCFLSQTVQCALYRKYVSKVQGSTAFLQLCNIWLRCSPHLFHGPVPTDSLCTVLCMVDHNHSKTCHYIPDFYSTTIQLGNRETRVWIMCQMLFCGNDPTRRQTHNISITCRLIKPKLNALIFGRVIEEYGYDYVFTSPA